MGKTNRQIAEEAVEFACALIEKSYTQENAILALANKKRSSTLMMLGTGISQLRKNAQHLIPYEFFEYGDLLSFTNSIYNSAKYSLGNCAEFADLALWYILTHYPDVRAEAFFISGGDHAFIVIGRAPGSVASKPEEWGDDAVICDAWSKAITGKFSVFPAKDYATHLTGFAPSKKHRLATNINNSALVYKLMPEFNRKMVARISTAILSLDTLELRLKQRMYKLDGKNRQLVFHSVCNVHVLVTQLKALSENINEIEQSESKGKEFQKYFQLQQIGFKLLYEKMDIEGPAENALKATGPQPKTSKDFPRTKRKHSESTKKHYKFFDDGATPSIMKQIKSAFSFSRY